MNEWNNLIGRQYFDDIFNILMNSCSESKHVEKTKN